METAESVSLSKWSSLMFRGIASILFGVVAFAWPGITLAALTLLFGAYAFADGVTTLIIAAHRGAKSHRWLLVVDGLLGIAAGVATVLWPGWTLLALVLLVAARFTVTGLLQVATAISMHREIRAPWLYGLAGLASLGLGIVSFVLPGITALVLVTMLAAYSLVFGVMMLVLSIRARSAAPVPAHAAA